MLFVGLAPPPPSFSGISLFQLVNDTLKKIKAHDKIISEMAGYGLQTKVKQEENADLFLLWTLL